MSGCEGLHCPGCGSHGGGRVAVIGGAVVLVLLAAEWVAARIWWLLGGTVLIAALTLSAVLWLMRWTGRREAAWGARRAALRAEQPGEIGNGLTGICRRPTDFTAGIGTGVPVSGAIEGGLHYHFHGLDIAEQAEAIRRAIDPR